MDIRYAVFVSEDLTDINDIDDSITSWIIPLLVSIYPTWEFVEYDTLVKVDDGNVDGLIWIGWKRNSEGQVYDPNWVPPEDPPEDPLEEPEAP